MAKKNRIINNRKYMNEYDGLLQVGVVVFLFMLLLGNCGVFFFFKNSTRDLRLAIRVIDRDIVEENRKLAVIQTEFNRRYSAQILQQMAKDRLNLGFSNVKQIKTIDAILAGE